jgi:hypothetical protein
MPIIGMATRDLWADGSFIGTVTVNMAPSNVAAQVGLQQTTKNGVHQVGIVSYRFRPIQGPEQQVDFGEWWSWASTVFVERMTSITFGVANATGSMRAYGNIFFWS